MKKSRTGVAIVVIIFLVIGFVGVLAGLSLMGATGDDGFFSEIFAGDNKVGIVKIEGAISSSDAILKQLRKFRKKKSVKAIVLRINSPGGSVAPAQEIYREIEKTKTKKPVVASIETLGTSAAYYIAGNCTKVVSSRGSITGSIGVIMVLADIHRILDQVGLRVNVIKAGKFKDIGSGMRPLTEEERAILEKFAEEIHEQFIQDVAEARKGHITVEKLRSVADGSFFTGERAKELGLVDIMGNFHDAVGIAAKLGKIKGEPELVYPEKKWDSLLDALLQSTTSAIARAVAQSRLIHQVPSVR